MQMGRIILLGLALLAGGGAILLVFLGGGNTENVEIVEQRPDVELVNVLVANREFKRGQRINAVETKWVKWPITAITDHFITDENQEYIDTIGDALARTIIVEGEPIFESKLVRSTDKGVLSALLTPGMRAISIDVTTSQGASGFILPGDRVDLQFSFEENTRARTALFSNLKVLAIDQTLDSAEKGAVILGSTVTLEVHPLQVQQLIAKKELGSANLILRSIFKPDGSGDLDQEFQPSAVHVIRYGQS